ncbi:SPOSA6832_02694, partial [Sporobolomyces salmonicolor]
MSAPSIEYVVSLIVGTDAGDVEKTCTLLPSLFHLHPSCSPPLLLPLPPAPSSPVIPQLKKLDKQSESSTTSKDLSPDGAGGAAAAAPTAHVLEGMLEDGQDPLSVLDPHNHTVGYLAILGTSPAAGAKRNPADHAARQPTVNYLVSQLSDLAQAAGDASLPVRPLKTLVRRWGPPATLTTLHPFFLRQVMHARMYEAAREVLNVDISDVDKSHFPIKYQDHLLYHYLGGTILALLGDYVRASDLLEICVSAPGSAVSLIQIDAYKKLLVVQLLAYGKILPLPKYTSQAATTAFKALCVPYLDYASAFALQDRGKLAQSKEKGRETFVKDLNWGLISLCDTSLRRRLIQKLTDTWMTLSLGQLTAALGMDASDEKQVEDVEREVRGMVSQLSASLALGGLLWPVCDQSSAVAFGITAKEIFATLDTPSPSSASSSGPVPLAARTVTFTDDPEPYLSHATVARVTAAIERAKSLERGWAEEAERLEEAREFVQKAFAAAAVGPGSSGAGASGLGFSDEFDYGSAAGFGAGGAGSGMSDAGEIDLDSD